MVDPDSVSERFDQLGPVLGVLEQIRAEGQSTYEKSFRTRLATYHAIQLAIQVCIDVGAHLVSELGLPAPTEYRDVFKSLEAEGLDPDLAKRLMEAAGTRNVVVHGYAAVDDEQIWKSLGELDDLRAFAAWVQELIEKDQPAS